MNNVIHVQFPERAAQAIPLGSNITNVIDVRAVIKERLTWIETMQRVQKEADHLYTEYAAKCTDDNMKTSDGKWYRTAAAHYLEMSLNAENRLMLMGAML
jgi:hypothetical protein